MIMARKGKGRFQANPMLRQLEQLQAQLMKAQEDLGAETVTATVGGGAVTVVMNGHQEIQSVKISPAVNEASNKAKELAASKMGGLTGGLNIPGLM